MHQNSPLSLHPVLRFLQIHSALPASHDNTHSAHPPTTTRHGKRNLKCDAALCRKNSASNAQCAKQRKLMGTQSFPVEASALTPWLRFDDMWSAVMYRSSSFALRVINTSYRRKFSKKVMAIKVRDVSALGSNHEVQKQLKGSGGSCMIWSIRGR
jgi:hypothetical protein